MSNKIMNFVKNNKIKRDNLCNIRNCQKITPEKLIYAIYFCILWRKRERMKESARKIFTGERKYEK